MLFHINNRLTFDTRDDLVNYYLQPGMVGAELGIFAGQFSEILLRTNPACLYLVDIFIGKIGAGDRNGYNKTYRNMEIVYDILCEQYKHDKRVKLIKSTTAEFLTQLATNSLDFVYIDADHTYPAVMSDLHHSLRVVKSNGFIMGHDYVSGPGYEQYGVIQAVDEFCAKHGFQIDGLSLCGCPSFCIPILKTDANSF